MRRTWRRWCHHSQGLYPSCAGARGVALVPESAFLGKVSLGTRGRGEGQGSGMFQQWADKGAILIKKIIVSMGNGVAPLVGVG